LKFQCGLWKLSHGLIFESSIKLDSFVSLACVAASWLMGMIMLWFAEMTKKVFGLVFEN